MSRVEHEIGIIDPGVVVASPIRFPSIRVAPVEIDMPAGGSPLIVTDVDGDGKQDIVCADARGNAILIGAGDGNFVAPAAFPSPRGRVCCAASWWFRHRRKG